MAQGLRNLAKNAVQKIGFVVDLKAEPDKCLKHLLAQFKKRQSKLRKLTVPASDSPLFRYYCCLFVMSILAYRRLQWENRKGSDWPKKEPIAFPLPANVDSKETKRERFLYRFMVTYYFNLMKDYQNRYSSFRSEPELCKLRDNILSIFEPTRRSGKKLGVERGKAINLLVKKEKIEQTIYFWKKEDFSDEDLDDPSVRQIHIPREGLPVTSIPGEVLYRLLDGLRKSDFWKKWEKEAAEKQKAIKPKGNTEEILWSHLKKEADTLLSYQLHGREDDYRSVELQAGYTQKSPELNEIDMLPDSEKRRINEHGRKWNPFNWHALLDSRDVYILSSDLGTGKTTFLRYLQKAVLEESSRIPIFLEASKIEKWAFTNEDSFVNYLSKKLQSWLPKGKAFRFLKKQLNHNILFLVDGLDQIEGVGTAYWQLLARLFMVVKNGLIVASRPFAVTHYENETSVTFLRLEPFHNTLQKDYFGDGFDRACQICKSDQRMLGVPILAFMVRTLIEEKQDHEVKNRADLYKEFINYLFQKYKHEGSELSRDLRISIRRALQKISYDALADGDINSQRIPLEFCQDCIFKLGFRIRVDDLPKCGLLNFALDKTAGAEEFLMFTHQSFQEYLAAKWASKREGRINYLIQNYWDPKWREGIKFLVGMKGEELVKELYPGPEHDNCIHSRLLFAAECLGETTVGKEFENCILNRFMTGPLKNIIGSSEGPAKVTGGGVVYPRDAYLRFGGSIPFTRAVILALATFGTKLARNTAWELVKNLIWQGELHHFLSESGIMSPLFCQKNLNQLLSTIKNRLYQSWHSEMSVFDCLQTADEVIRAWSFVMPEECIDKVFDTLHSICLERKICFVSKGIEALASRLKSGQVKKVLSAFGDNPHMFGMVVAIRSRLEEEQITLPTEQLDSEDIWRPYHCKPMQKALEDVVDFVSVFEVERLLRKFLSLDENRRKYWTGTIAKFGNRLDQEQIERLIGTLEDCRKYVRKSSIEVLTWAWDRRSQSQFEKILKYLEDPFLGPHVIKLVARAPERVGEDLIRRILDFIGAARPEIRSAAMDSIERFWPYVANEHIDAIAKNLEDRECQDAAIKACSYIGDRLDNEMIWLIIHALRGYTQYAVLCAHKRNALASIAPYLKREHVRFLLKTIGTTCNPDRICMMVQLLWPGFLTAEDLCYLSNLPEHWDIWVRRAAYEKLCRIHEKGLL